MSKASIILKSKRKELNLSVNEVVNRLSQNNVNISAKTLYGWESGNRQPDADTFLVLCTIYGINSFGLPENSQDVNIPLELANIYNNLNYTGQTKLMDYAKDLYQLPQYKKCDTVSDQDIG